MQLARLISRMSIVSLVPFIISLGIYLPASLNECGRGAQYGVGCPGISGSLGDGAANLSGERNTTNSGSGGTGRGSGAPQSPAPPNKNRMTPEQRLAYENQLVAEAAARGDYYRPEFWSTYVGTPPTNVTLNDIATFRPTVGGNHMEPNGWIVVGLDTNFYSDPSVHIVDGTLLGLPASVRFTAKSYTWTYGDGASHSSPTPGTSWAAQNLPEFSPTATSHVFANPGSYTIDLAVGYSAEYRFGANGWVPIAGTLVVPANRIVATAGDASTVLVGRDCRENPGGPGC